MSGLALSGNWGRRGQEGVVVMASPNGQRTVGYYRIRERGREKRCKSEQTRPTIATICLDHQELDGSSKDQNDFCPSSPS